VTENGHGNGNGKPLLTATEDLAVGTTRPGDFADDPEVVRERGEGAVEPNPHERDESEGSPQ
jgi:hypothetical protein